MPSPSPASTTYLSLCAAARRASVSERTLTRAIRSGALRAYRVGRLVRISDVDLQSFLERHPLVAAD